MSYPVSGPRRRGGRGVLRVLLAVLAVAAVGTSGSWLDAETATYVPSPLPVVGRTTTVCAVTPPEPGSRTSLAAVVVRQAPGREGALTVTALGEDTPGLSLTEQGKGELLPDQKTTYLLQGEGVMASASSAEVFSTAATGVQRGLMAAPCGAPATEHWFVGVGASSSARSELVLTNPDDSQAEVDLQFFDEGGEVVVPGGPGIVVDAHGSRTIGLQSLADVSGPLTVSVRSTAGRVAAVARDLRSSGADAGGAEWHTSSTSPATRQVVPDVPEGAGERQLVVTNPGAARAQVEVQILAQAGPFAPVGAETLEVAPNSTVAVDLAPGLVGQNGAVSLTSDRPVTGAVVATSRRTGAATDFAVQAATPPLVRTGVVALATGPSGEVGDAPAATDNELVLSNDADEPAMVGLEVLTYSGVSLRTDDVLIGARSTSTRRLDLEAPAYLVVRVPTDSRIHGGVVYSQPEGSVAGLASASLTSPDVASRGPVVVLDPVVGR